MIKIISSLLNASLTVELAERWNSAVPHVTGIIVVFLFVLISILYYRRVMVNLKVDETPNGYALIIYTLIESVKGLVRDILGPEFEKITPYFIFLASYIFCSNMIGIFGLENPTGSITVTFSLGIITFIGMLVVGFRYQRISYLTNFTINISVKSKKKGKKIPIPVMINPMSIIGKITPLISISLRIWGNIFAGGMIMTLLYTVPMLGSQGTQALIDGPPDPLMLLAALYVPPLVAFFDILSGSIQTMVFMFLTMIYWTLEKGEGEPEVKPQEATSFIVNEKTKTKKQTTKTKNQNQKKTKTNLNV